MDTSPIHNLPPELLQKVWSSLPLFDLLRCQRVCKGWNTYLPGDDQALHRAMFSPATVATSPDTASWDVYIDFRQHHRVQMGALPRLVFSLDVTASAPSRGTNFRVTPEGKCIIGTTYHPILNRPYAFNKLIRPEFPRNGIFETFEFTDVQDLKFLEKEPESNNEFWQKMLAQIPKVKKLKTKVSWRTSIQWDRNDECIQWDKDDEWRGTERNHILENETGVTVGDFVQLIRQELKNAATELTNYGGQLTSIEGYSFNI